MTGWRWLCNAADAAEASETAERQQRRAEAAAAGWLGGYSIDEAARSGSSRAQARLLMSLRELRVSQLRTAVVGFRMQIQLAIGRSAGPNDAQFACYVPIRSGHDEGVSSPRSNGAIEGCGDGVAERVCGQPTGRVQVDQTRNLSINLSINRSVYQSINQSINLTN
jgi:hypothetical protein